MPNPSFMLLADWSEVIGFIVLVGFGVLRYLLGELGQGKEKRPAERPPGPAADRRGKPADAQSDLRSEVDDFLRRAKGLPEPEPPELELMEDPDPPRQWERPRGLQAERLPSASEQPVSVADHVSRHVRHLEESQLAENAARLGEEVALADDKVQARLEAKFGHQLGKLGRGLSSSQAVEEPPPAVAAAIAADQIAAMLANPEGVRNAIILNEILQRPADRW